MAFSSQLTGQEEDRKYWHFGERIGSHLPGRVKYFLLLSGVWWCCQISVRVILSLMFPARTHIHSFIQCLLSIYYVADTVLLLERFTIFQMFINDTVINKSLTYITYNTMQPLKSEIDKNMTFFHCSDFWSATSHLDQRFSNVQTVLI